MGGDCLNTGCVPSKTLIRSAQIAHEMRTADRYGIGGVEPEVQFPAVMERVQAAIRDDRAEGLDGPIPELGVDCIAGEAVLEDAHHVRVGERVISTRSVSSPPAPGRLCRRFPVCREAGPLTSDNLWALGSCRAPAGHGWRTHRLRAGAELSSALVRG